MSQIQDPSNMEWTPLAYPGIRAKVLRHDPETGDRAAIIELDEGARYPLHDHPGGEHALMLEGELKSGGHILKAGQYLHTPPGKPHAVVALTKCRFFVVTPKGVVLVEKG